MEYVFGESLAQVINRHPNGLPTELIREWFAALSRGVSYLHDQGVVHRDLKPANIFIEHGHLKVGDYGLSRRMSSSERGEVTRGVGTPHYMAPEIKNGNYGRSIDVYACGVILFEMLTGRPVFDGETPAEVLMKHQLDAPDLGKLPAAIKPIVERALEKDPTKRFQSMMEFAKAVEAVLGGAARDGNGSTVTLIPPLDAKMPAADTVVDEKLPLPKGKVIPVARPVAKPYIPSTFRERLTELAGGFALTPLVAAACTIPFALFQDGASWTLLGRVFLLSTALTWALLLVGRLPRRDAKNPWGRRAVHLAVGLGVGVLACLARWVVDADGYRERHDPRHRVRDGTSSRSRHVHGWYQVPVLLRAGDGRVPVVGCDRPEAEGTGAADTGHRRGFLGHGFHVPVALGRVVAGDGRDRDAGNRGGCGPGGQPVGRARTAGIVASGPPAGAAGVCVVGECFGE